MSTGSRARLAMMLLHLAGIAAFSASLRPDGQAGSNCAANGDIAFRKSDFAGAESLYRRALTENDTCAHAVWGLGRIEELNFRRAAARDYYASAFRLDPRDPRIIRSYASVVTDGATESLLLRNYIAVGGDGLGGSESALGHIQMHQRLGAREVDTLDTPYHSYTLP